MSICKRCIALGIRQKKRVVDEAVLAELRLTSLLRKGSRGLHHRRPEKEMEIESLIERLKSVIVTNAGRWREERVFAFEKEGITACGTNVSNGYSMRYHPGHFQMLLEADSCVTTTQELKFIIWEISREWGFADEVTKAKLDVLTKKEELASLADVFSVDSDDYDAFELPLEARADTPDYLPSNNSRCYVWHDS